MPVTCRFAPSPNGPLHLGHAYSALCNERVAAQWGGDCLLRLEDIDILRCTPALQEAACADLRWFGYPWRGPVRRQSEGTERYGVALGRLAARGLLFPCFCPRGAIAQAVGDDATWPRDPDGSPVYPGSCRALPPAIRAARIAAGEAHALRLDMRAALAALAGPLVWTEYREGIEAVCVPADPAVWGDAVVRRKDIPTSYHLAVVVDDADQGITDVVRGEDLFAATGLHRLLQALLDLPAPRYHHHRLLRDEAGRKLSKSRQSPALARLREEGVTPGEVRRRLDGLMTRPGTHGSSITSQ